jgi:hypothetical protein
LDLEPGLSNLPAPEQLALRENPDIANAFRSNPDPMLGLLRRMMEAAKGK